MLKNKTVSPHFLNEEQIEKLLKKSPDLHSFWQQRATLLLFRGTPCPSDPVYEIQLVLDWGDRLETWGWVWVEALEGQILRLFPD